jgi:hypothetical protein
VSYENALADILKKRNSELFGRLLKIKQIAVSLLSYTQGKFPYFTPHDFSHSMAVEENLNWLLPDDIKDNMNANEIFFLIVAAWMHDWGMVGKPEEDPEQIREIHNLRTEKYFEEMYSKLFLTEHEGLIIGRISRGHTKENLFDTKYDDEVFGSSVRIRRRFLAAVLRIADECDITYNRTPEVVYYTLSPKDKAEQEFKKHLSISGVGQLDEKHKIYISAVARDPKGAKTLRMVRDKVQGELDVVKSILASNGIVLDTVELRIETRGFVDKPIGIEINKKKIVDLLMGEHLYSRRDAAIRELVQNAIDACRAKMQTKKDSVGKITLTKPDENTIVVEDNGLGMDYSTAKKYLSVIGDSYYSSEDFSKFIKERRFEPIALFGIGILSCFLISEGLTIETKKDGQEPCRFTINELEEDWKYEKGQLSDSGTKIILRLNDYGKAINIQKTLQRYFAVPEIDIYFQDHTGTLKKFERIWSADKIAKRFGDPREQNRKVLVNEIIRSETDSYQLILATASDFAGSLFVFNQGIFVENVSLMGLAYNCFFCVNAKKTLYDMQISREKIVKNEKWNTFVHSLFSEFFDFVFEKLGNDEVAYINFVDSLLERRMYSFELEEMFEDEPFLRSVLEKALFPFISQDGKLSFSRLDRFPKTDDYCVYFTYAHKPLEEIKLVSKLVRTNKIVILSPYSLPKIKKKDQRGNYIDVVTFMLKRKANVAWTDLNRLMVENSNIVEIHYEDIIPNNVKLAGFPDNWKPLAIIKQPALVSKSPYLGSAYWGNILLWKKLALPEVLSQSAREFAFEGKVINSVRLITEHVTYIDAQDQFVQKVLNERVKGVLDEKTTKKVFRYFVYLSYLPLVLSNMSSCVIFFDAIDNLEKEITEILQLAPSDQVIKRFQPNFQLYQDYYANCEQSTFYLESS